MKQVPVDYAWQVFKPERLVLIVTRDEKNKRYNIMPAGWSMHCSFDPPLIAISIGKTRYTHKLIKQSREFVIAVPNKGMEEIVDFTGSHSGRNVDKLKELGIKTEKAKHVGAPLIKDATLNFECKLWSELETGDHTIFVGEILVAYANPDKKILFSFGRRHGRWVFREIQDFNI